MTISSGLYLFLDIWGGDFILIDLPPGTGDAQLSISQLCEVAGAIIVSTPQDVALLDAMKAVNMFSKVDIDIVGVIENMSQFICPKCGESSVSSRGRRLVQEQSDETEFLDAELGEEIFYLCSLMN